MCQGSDLIVTMGFVECPVVDGDGDSGSAALRANRTYALFLCSGLSVGIVPQMQLVGLFLLCQMHEPSDALYKVWLLPVTQNPQAAQMCFEL